MAKKSSKSAVIVTPDRVRRLYRLVKWLGEAPQSRTSLARRLRLNIRTFYRDLTVLEDLGIIVDQDDGKYKLRGQAEQVAQRLPFPDPALTLAEARQLAKGKSPGHRKIKAQIDFIEGT
jgi:predicted transcriptional regulator